MPPTDIELEDRVFMSNPLVVIGSTHHRLARRQTLTLRDLREDLFILRERGSGTRMAADAHFKSAKFAAKVKLELGSNEAIREAVAAGLGVSVVSRHALGPRPTTQHGVTVLPVEGFPVPSQWHIVWHKGKRLSPVAQVFGEHLQAQPEPWA
jgi:DNA-binding transcriptional LysR family regulator